MNANKTYQSILLPYNILSLVGIGVREARNGAGVTAEKAVEVGADLVALALTKSVALSASGLEKVGTLLCVTCFQLAIAMNIYFESRKTPRRVGSRSKCNRRQDTNKNSL
jgi:hypothetical protein